MIKDCDVKDRYSLYAITDRRYMIDIDIADAVEKAILGGATCIQLREKAIDKEAYVRLAIKIKAITQKHSIPLIINDDPEVALLSQADGVHLGQSDTDIMFARRMLGSDKIIGVTAHNVDEAVKAYNAGADYLGVGACFTSGSKTDTIPLSYEELCRICRRVSIPVVAIGGIDITNITKLAGSGISGIACIAVIFDNPKEEITKRTEELRKNVDMLRL